MERRINLNQFFEIMGGQDEAEKFFDQIIEDNIAKNAKSDTNQIVSVVHSRVEKRNRINNLSVEKFTISTMLIIEKKQFNPDGLDIDFENEFDAQKLNELIAFEVSPVLFYVCEFDKEMPDCVLDMMNLSKRIKARRDDGSFSEEWLLDELKKFPEYID
jgi:hypothetical protein